MHCSVRTKIEILIVLTVNVLILRNLQEQVKKHSVSKIGLTFNCLIEWIENSDLKKIANSRPSASNFKSSSISLEQFFLTEGYNNFGNKILT